MAITNDALKNYTFLQQMDEDDYFPKQIVHKGKQILVRLCESIEAQSPKDEENLLRLTHGATEEFNALQEEFEAEGSEIETGAREAIAGDFDTIVKAYGFDVDVEEVIAPRDW